MNSNYINAVSLTELYTGKDLGLQYGTLSSVFKVWAPSAFSVAVVVYETGGAESAAGPAGTVEDHGHVNLMRRNDNGVWQAEVAGDLKGKYYMYRAVYADGSMEEAADPYARAVSANGVRTAIVDLRDTDPEHWEQDVSPSLPHPADAVIYELHVRDFSAHQSSGMRYKGKFKAFTETGLRDAAGNMIGIDHLAELGITHVHLMPVFDYQTVDELNRPEAERPEAYYTDYNWGYDPQHYNVPEGSYSTDASDPGLRIREFKEMVQALHSQGIAVIMDVVYNHTYAVEKGPFEPLAPDYFYRRDYTGRLSNGSGVGNELATERPMVRKYIKDSLAYWATEYHIDGFRFDLMGLMDSVTMREITEELRLEVNPELLLYGEPWTGGDSPLATKTLKGVQRGKGYAVFNDNFRSAIKGDSDGWGRGFITGEHGREGAIASGIMGAIHDFTESPVETVNYVTAHDNLNLWDKLLAVQGLRQQARFPVMENGRLKDGGSVEAAVAAADPYVGVDPEHVLDNEIVRRSLLASGIILASQGIPFLNAGDELLRSKYGDHNSYRSSDAINAIRWSGKQVFQPVFRYYKGLIELRRAHPAFRLHGRQEIERSLQFLRCEGGVVSYMLKDHAGGDSWQHIVVIFNANTQPVIQDLTGVSGSWNVVVDHSGAGTEVLRRVEGQQVELEGLSMMVLYDRSSEPGPRAKVIEVHYERPDGQYQGWNLWVWGTGIQDGQNDFRQMEDGRAVARIEVLPDTQSIGYLLRLNDWEEKDGEGDRFIDCSSDDELIRVLVRDRESSEDGTVGDSLQLTS
ncbi:type I pullulanase [Paenibacillus donghaensis]|uniref:pullulanase n=1 Tax=Paenibacillus donghaensis TaxID=414771 RepID=A0A2Z2K3L1_9BACL|nr:type I pullulanase [Paenibacillus donghaensis]ASA19986.1 type I pullulanase [Paenibacillus donghaensis]